MNAPGWADNSLLILHYDVSCLVSFAHHVEYHIVLRNLEVHVNFHTSLMSMSRHGVPYAARIKHGHAHGKLAGLKNVRMDELIDYALIGSLHSAQRLLCCLLNRNKGCLAGLVSRCTHHVELCRVRCIVAGEEYFLCSLCDV